MSKGVPPSSRRATVQLKLRRAAHLRWHVKRGIVSPRCPLCRPGARRPPTKTTPRRRISLAEKDVDVLRQLTARVAAVDSASHQYVGLVSLLVAFIRGIVGE